MMQQRDRLMQGNNYQAFFANSPELYDMSSRLQTSNSGSTTQQSLFNVAMAYENQNILNEEEKLILLEPWHKLTDK